MERVNLMLAAIGRKDTLETQALSRSCEMKRYSIPDAAFTQRIIAILLVQRRFAERLTFHRGELNIANVFSEWISQVNCIMTVHDPEKEEKNEKDFGPFLTKVIEDKTFHLTEIINVYYGAIEFCHELVSI